MKEENYQHKLSEDKSYTLKAINRLAIGVIIILWGSLLALREIGIIDKGVSTWPFAFVAFGVLLVFGGVYRLSSRENCLRRTARWFDRIVSKTWGASPLPFCSIFWHNSSLFKECEF